MKNKLKQFEGYDKAVKDLIKISEITSDEDYMILKIKHKDWRKFQNI